MPFGNVYSERIINPGTLIDVFPMKGIQLVVVVHHVAVVVQLVVQRVLVVLVRNLTMSHKSSKEGNVPPFLFPIGSNAIQYMG